MEIKDKIKSYIEIPEAQLLAIIREEHNQVLNTELKIVEDWILNERCECCKNPLIKNKKISIDCEHINSEIRPAIKEGNEKLELMHKVLRVRLFAKHNIPLQTFKITGSHSS